MATLFISKDENLITDNLLYIYIIQEIFSLFAYADPSKGRMAYLMDISNRETLATKLNSIMLGMIFFFFFFLSGVLKYNKNIK